MSEITLREALYTTRAMRRLRADPVPEEDLRFVVDAATQAPSGENAQPWAFVVVTDADQRRRIGEAYRALAAASIKTMAEEGGDVPEAEQRIYRNAWRLAERFADVPALVVACMRTPIPDDRAWTATYYGSIFPAVQNLMLAARSRGLGTVLTTLHLLDETPFKKILEIPDDVHTFAIIPVGYPEGRFARPRRQPSAEVTHWNRWGEASS